MKHKAAVSLTSPPLSLSFIILIVITADNVSNERQVGSLQADEQVRSKSIALFIGDPGDEPVFVKGLRGSDRPDFQGISRQPGSMASALRVWKFNWLMQRKKREQKRERGRERGRKGRCTLPGVSFTPTRNAIFLHRSTLTFFLPPSDILSSTNRKTCQLRFSQSSRSALIQRAFPRRKSADARDAARRVATRRMHAFPHACLHIA